MAATKTQLTGGAFQDPDGNVLVNGYLIFELSQDEKVIDSNVLICAGIRIKILLNSSGSIDTSTPQYIWGNDDLLPVNSFYRIWGYTSEGQLAWGPNSQQVVSGATFDVGTWIPNQLTNWNPPLTPTILETNGVKNGDQALLNLKNGTNVTVSDDGLGGVTINAATPAGVTLKTNGTTNSSQTVLNLQQGAGISIVDGGSGNISINGGQGRVSYGALQFVTSGSAASAVISGQMSNSNQSFNGSATLAPLSATLPTSLQILTGTSNDGFFTLCGNSPTLAAAMPVKNGLYFSSHYGIFDAGSFVNANHYPIAVCSLNPMLDSSGTDPIVANSFIGFRSNGTNWVAIVSNGSASTSTTTSVALDTNTHLFEVYVQAASVLFYIDGVLVATITTHIPTAGTAVIINSAIQTTAGRVSSASGVLSWMYWSCSF